MGSRAEERIRRAEVLTQRIPEAGEALRFFLRVAEFQRGLQDTLRGKLTPPPLNAVRLPLQAVCPRDHRALLAGPFAAFLDLVRQVGPPELAEAAAELQEAAPDLWEALWERYWRGELRAREAGPAAFFPKAFLQPYAALLAEGFWEQGGRQVREGGEESSEACCPLCGAPPQVAVLREEGHGAARFLVCSRCEMEWRYKRGRCVSCGEEESSRLVYLHATEWPHVRIAACGTCLRYIKEVDLTRDGLAEPVVDELATLALDLVAMEQGYQKVELNLIGL